MEQEPNDATPFLPEKRTLDALRDAAAGCRGCHLWHGATQTVFGEGPSQARVLVVGEQPGNSEDLEGVPSFLHAVTEVRLVDLTSVLVREGALTLEEICSGSTARTIWRTAETRASP